MRRPPSPGRGGRGRCARAAYVMKEEEEEREGDALLGGRPEL